MTNKILRIFILCIIFSLIFIFITTIFALLFYNLNNPLISYNTELTKNIDFFDAYYFSTITFFTVGYGEIYPIDQAGRLFAILEGYIGLLYNLLFSGFLLHEIFDITISELTDMARGNFKFPSNYKCYPTNNGITPFTEKKTGFFEVDFSHINEEWGSCVIHIHSKQNWTWLAKHDRNLCIKLYATGLESIKLEIKGPNKRIDNNNISFNEKNGYSINMNLLEINNCIDNWKEVLEICFVVENKGLINKISNFQIKEMTIKNRFIG